MEWTNTSSTNSDLMGKLEHEKIKNMKNNNYFSNLLMQWSKFNKFMAAEMKRKQHFKPNIDGNLQMKTLMKKIRSKIAYEF